MPDRIGQRQDLPVDATLVANIEECVSTPDLVADLEVFLELKHLASEHLNFDKANVGLISLNRLLLRVDNLWVAGGCLSSIVVSC